MSVACREKEATATEVPMPVSVSANISYSELSADLFEHSECIGLFMTNLSGDSYVDNMPLFFNGGWQPASSLYWQDTVTPVDFLLYSPYDASMSNPRQYRFSVKRDQSEPSTFRNSCLLAGSATNVSPTLDTVDIAMHPLISQIMVRISAGPGVTAESLANAEIAVRINGVKCDLTADLTTGTSSPCGEISTIIPHRNSNEFTALIPPQTVEECNLITIMINGREYTSKKSFTFEQGKRHLFTLTVSGSTTGGLSVAINSWTDDGSDHGGTAE